tara:strand:+ start:2683 stop:3723 length:1041 start_codon:yes stop_codon:yes gene_type:complete
MKILILKEKLDQLGSYNYFEYKDNTFNKICDYFKTKANGIHSVFCFDADYFIIDNKTTKYNYKKNLSDNICNYINKNTKLTHNINNININNYDIIWCRDDIIDVIKLKNLYPDKLFIYENVEHAFANFNYDYDLILDHTDFSFRAIQKLNTKISFPYPINKDILRKNIDCIKSKTIYFDSRDIIQYAKIANTSIDNINSQISNFMKQYNISVNIVNKRPEKHLSPLLDNDSNITNTLTYFNRIGQSKYFVLTFPRLGQSLVEAAALNCIVIGTKKSINSPFICHKECLFNDFASLEQIKNNVLYLESKPELQKEILEYQDKMLTKYYYEHQKNVLQKALELKKKCF